MRRQKKSVGKPTGMAGMSKAGGVKVPPDAQAKNAASAQRGKNRCSGKRGAAMRGRCSGR